MTPQEWRALSYTEQKARWHSLSSEEQAAITAGDSESHRTGVPRSSDAITTKPASAWCCHILATLSAIMVFAAFAGGLLDLVPDPVTLGVGAAVGGMIWWVLGDIVELLHQIAHSARQHRK